MKEGDAEKTAIGTSKEAVVAIPLEYVHFDREFPAIPIKPFADDSGGNTPELATAFAKQYVDVRASAGSQPRTIEATRYLGRASTSEPGIVLSTCDGRRTIVSIKTKPTGVPSIVRNSWQDYEREAKTGC